MKTVKNLALVTFSLLLCMLIIGTKVNAPNETVLRVEPKKSNVSVGSSFEVDVFINDVFNLYGYEFQLNYDTNMLTITDMKPHMEDTSDITFFFQEFQVWKYEINDDLGYAWLAVTLPYGSPEGQDGDGILATIRFTANNPGVATLTIPLHLLGDPHSVAIDHTVVQGKVTVGAEGQPIPSTFDDETPPSGFIKIAEGASYTNQASVKLTLSGYDEESGIDQMRLSNDGATWTEWETYTNSKKWTLTPSDGTKTVYVQYKDKAGLESQVYQDTIELDATPPTITINSPSHSSEINSFTTEVQWTGTDTGSGIDHYEVSIDGDSWVNVGNKATHALSSLTDGSHTVEVKAIDKAGNLATASSSFTVNAGSNSGALYLEAIMGASVIAPLVGVALYLKKFAKKN